MNPIKARNGSKLLSISQITAEYGLPKSTVYELIARGVLPHVQPPGVRRFFVRREALEAAIAAWEITRA
jgi:excisionase family DNA binding protein